MSVEWRFYAAVAFAALSLMTTPSLGENYGHIPSSKIYLGAGFSPLLPNQNFPLCIVSKGECQTSANGSVACLGGATPPIQQDAIGSATNFKVKQIESKYEFFREVNIQASLSGSYGPFSGSGSFSSYSLDDIKEDSLTWMVAAKSSYGSFALIDPSMHASAKGLSSLDLVSKCGSSYVSSIDRGVMAAAIFSVYNLDEKHRREIRATLSASFSTGAFGVDGKGDFKDVMRTALQYGTMNINVYALGGTGTTDLAEAIKANPTDLDTIKAVLSDYVKKQDAKHSAIVGFQTTGFGKLVGRPSIDPDQSDYVYFLESANEFRLRIIGAIQRVETLLDRESDFDPAIGKKARELHSKLICELRVIETGMKSCRMSYELTNFVLVDGDAVDDQAASLAQRYGISGSTISKRLLVCPLSESALDLTGAKKAGGSKALVTMGWLGGTSTPGSGAQAVKAPPKQVCSERLSASEARFAEMIRTSLDANESNRKKAPVGAQKPLCVSGCDFDLDREVLSDTAKLPRLPFEIRHWFDSLGVNFSSKNSPGLYVQITKANSVSQIRAYNDKDAMPFGVRVNEGGANISLFFGEQALRSDQSPARLEVDTINGNTYTIDLPRIKLM